MAKELSRTSESGSTAGSSALSETGRSYSGIQLFFLSRLAGFLRQQRACRDQFSVDSWRMRLVNKAVFSTYCDCLALDVEEEAKALFVRESERKESQSLPAS